MRMFDRVCLTCRLSRATGLRLIALMALALAGCSPAGGATPAEVPIPPLAPSPTPTVEVAGQPFPEGATGTINGQVLNITTGQPVEPGSDVILHAVTADLDEVLTETTQTDGEGSYTFEGLPLELPDAVYVATVKYNNVVFTSDLVVFPPGHTQLELPVELYETTSDPSVLTAETLHVFVSRQPGALQVSQLHIFTNGSDQGYLSDVQIDETRRAALRIPVPPEADNFLFEQGQLGKRFVPTDEGLLDTIPVRPHSTHRILVTYTLPYTDEYTLRLPMAYDTRVVNVLVERADMRVNAPALSRAPSQEAQGRRYDIFTGQDFAAGQVLEVRFTAKAGLLPGGPLAWVGVGVVLALLLTAAIALVLRRSGLDERASRRNWPR
jgi:hypothetical protein